MDLVGETLLDRYHLDALVRLTEYFEAYKAWDAHRNLEVTVKVLRQAMAQDGDFVRRFDGQVSALIELTHTNIERVFSFERDQERLFFVTENLPGLTLEQHAKNRQSIPETFSIVQQIGDALHYSHNRDVIHGNLYPGMIMVQSNGRVVVCDYGFARASKWSLGSPDSAAYLSPEQFRGQSANIRSDVYALGAIAYELFVGHRLFTGETAEISGYPMEKLQWEKLNLTPSPLRLYNPEISVTTETAILRCLALDPQERFHDVAQFLGAFRSSQLKDEKVALRESVTFQLEEPAATASSPEVIQAQPMAPAEPSSAAPTQFGSRRLLLVIGILIVSVMCLAMCAGGTYFIGEQLGFISAGSLQDMLEQIGLAQVPTSTWTPTASQTVTSRPTDTPSPQDTSTSTPNLLGTQIVESGRATRTSVAGQTATVVVKRQLTEQAIQETLAAAMASAMIIFGPDDGRLVHQDDGYMESTRSSRGVRNFIAEIRFFNPYPTSEGRFGYGFTFRSEGSNKQYRLFLTSNKEWDLRFLTGTVPGTSKQSGDLPNMDVSEDGSNLIRLIAIEDRGWLYVNDSFVAELDLSLRFMGSVYAYLVYENPGNITRFEGFTVWRIP